MLMKAFSCMIILVAFGGTVQADDATPACVSGTNVATGSYDQICGIVDVGGGCYEGTNVVTGEYEQVCGAN
jgi:hypothetical protein